MRPLPEDDKLLALLDELCQSITQLIGAARDLATIEPEPDGESDTAGLGPAAGASQDEKDRHPEFIPWTFPPPHP